MAPSPNWAEERSRRGNASIQPKCKNTKRSSFSTVLKNILSGIISSPNRYVFKGEEAAVITWCGEVSDGYAKTKRFKKNCSLNTKHPFKTIHTHTRADRQTGRQTDTLLLLPTTIIFYFFKHNKEKKKNKVGKLSRTRPPSTAQHSSGHYSCLWDVDFDPYLSNLNMYGVCMVIITVCVLCIDGGFGEVQM